MNNLLINYNDIETMLDLNAEDTILNELCFNSAYTYFQKNIGYELNEQKYTEIHKVIDNRIYLNQINITKVIRIYDLITNTQIKNYSSNSDSRFIQFYNNQNNQHFVSIEYTAGFMRDTIPSDIKESIIRFFIYKKNELTKEINGSSEETITILPTDIQETLNKYKRKNL